MDVKSILQLAEGFVKSPRGSQVLSNLKGKVTKNPENKPSIVTFVTKGRVYDQQTNESLQGVNIKPLEVLYPMKSFKNDEGKLEYKYDKDGNKEIKTDLNGEFEIRFGIPVLPTLPNVVLGQPKLTYTLNGYAPQLQTIITGNGEVLSQLPSHGFT